MRINVHTHAGAFGAGVIMEMCARVNECAAYESRLRTIFRHICLQRSAKKGTRKRTKYDSLNDEGDGV